jgi:hypothetical protein
MQLVFVLELVQGLINKIFLYVMWLLSVLSVRFFLKMPVQIHSLITTKISSGDNGLWMSYDISDDRKWLAVLALKNLPLDENAVPEDDVHCALRCHTQTGSMNRSQNNWLSFFGEKDHYSLIESIWIIVIDLQCIANTTDQRLQI